MPSMPPSARLPDAAADAPQPRADARRGPERLLRAWGLRGAGVLLALGLVAVLGWRAVNGPAAQPSVGGWGAGALEATAEAGPAPDRPAAVARVLLTHLQGLDPIDRTVALRDWEGALGLGLRWVPPAERPPAAVLRPGEWRRAPDGATLWLAVPRTAELASDAVDLLEVRGLPADRPAGRTSNGFAAVVLVGTLAAASLLLTALALRRRGRWRAGSSASEPLDAGGGVAVQSAHGRVPAAPAATVETSAGIAASAAPSPSTAIPATAIGTQPSPSGPAVAERTGPPASDGVPASGAGPQGEPQKAAAPAGLAAVSGTASAAGNPAASACAAAVAPERRAHRGTLGPFPDGQDLAGLLRREVDALRRDRAREAALGASTEAPGPSAVAAGGLQIDYDPWLEGPVDHEPALLARAVRGLLAQAAERAQRHLVLSARLEGGREVVVEIDDDGPLGGASDGTPPAGGGSPTRAASDVPDVPDDADWIFAEAVAEWHGGRARVERAPLGGLRRSLRWPLGWREPAASAAGGDSGAADGRVRDAPGRR